MTLPQHPTLTRRLFIGLGAGAGLAAAGLPGGLATALPTRPLTDQAWSFGLMSDTQWGADTDGKNPGSTAGGIQQILNKEFINKDVDFVIQVGDNVDRENNSYNGNENERTLKYKAQMVQPLYDAGIGFFTLRGNHEGSAQAAVEFPQVFPQHLGQGQVMAGAHNFSYPSEKLKGLSYSFDVKNVRIIMLDQFKLADGTSARIADQLDWIEQRVLNRPTDMHCLVFAHKNLVGQNHIDTLFGGSPEADPASYNRFMTIMQRGNVPMVIGGHDHVHHRSMVTSPDGRRQVQQLIAGSDSAKFYTPRVPSNDENYGGASEVVIAQELWTITHYVITVDGPCLWFDFYSMSTGKDYEKVYMPTTPPETGWYWREQWGYALNGLGFMINPGESYRKVRDTYKRTRMWLTDGVNTSTKKDYAGRAMSKHITTGWTDSTDGSDSANLYLWGIPTNLQLNNPDLEGLWPNKNETDESDRFVLTMSGNVTNWATDGTYGIATKDAEGKWVNAVAENFGGEKKFVVGAPKADYALGTYGVNPVTRESWAVLNHGGTFAIRKGI